MEQGNTFKTQVVIIGAGPAGLSMAAQLLRQNIDFIIIEKKEGTTKLSKALAVQARTLEIFQELGIAAEAVKRGQIAKELRLYYKGKQKLSININGLGEGYSEFSFALSLEQSKTEQLLVEYLARSGKQVRWKSEFTHFEESDEHVTVYYKDGQGIEQKIEAAYLVGCDGASSVVRHQLSLPFQGSTEPKLFYVADVLLASPVINKDSLYMFLIKNGFVLFFPMEGKGHYRMIGTLPATQDKKEYQFSDVEDDTKRQIVSPVDFEKLQWFSTYRIHTRKADAFMKGRCFIAGDAAHIHTPAGGQGMNAGIQDAYNLAWKLAYTIKGEVNASVLETYNSERTAYAKQLLQTTDTVFDLMSGVHPALNFLRLNFFPLLLRLITGNKFVKRLIFPLLSQTGIAYPHSYLTLKSSIGKVKAGDRMHYFVFSNGNPILHYLTEPVFKLLYFGSSEKNNPFADSKIKLTFISFNEIPSSVFGNATDFYVLLRPDNHISYIGKDIEKCTEMLDKISLK